MLSTHFYRLDLPLFFLSFITSKSVHATKAKIVIKLEKTKIVLNKTEQAITIEAADNRILFEEFVFESSSGSILIAYKLKKIKKFCKILSTIAGIVLFLLKVELCFCLYCLNVIIHHLYGSQVLKQ